MAKRKQDLFFFSNMKQCKHFLVFAEQGRTCWKKCPHRWSLEPPETDLFLLVVVMKQNVKEDFESSTMKWKTTTTKKKKHSVQLQNCYHHNVQAAAGNHQRFLWTEQCLLMRTRAGTAANTEQSLGTDAGTIGRQQNPSSLQTISNLPDNMFQLRLK